MLLLCEIYYNCSGILKLAYIYNFDNSGKEVKADATVEMSPINELNKDPYNAIDGDMKTYVHSMDVDNDNFKSFPTLNITLS